MVTFPFMFDDIVSWNQFVKVSSVYSLSTGEPDRQRWDRQWVIGVRISANVTTWRSGREHPPLTSSLVTSLLACSHLLDSIYQRRLQKSRDERRRIRSIFRTSYSGLEQCLVTSSETNVMRLITNKYLQDLNLLLIY